MEAPSTPRTVVTNHRNATPLQSNLLSSSRRSRPGPVSVATEGVFQPASSGKYVPSGKLPLPDSCSISSGHRHNDPEPKRPREARFLSVYYQNVRGIRTKTAALKLALSSCDYDVIVLTETWLRTDVADSEFSTGYSVFRCDRSENTSNLSRGGGVLIAVKSNLRCIAVSLENCEQIEQICVCLKLPHRSIYIFCIYFRPESDSSLYTAHVSAVQSICNQTSRDDVVLLLGDYNLPHLHWNFDDDVNGYLPSNASSDHELIISESVLSHGLVQMNFIKNFNDRLLDLAFSDSPNDFEIFQPPLPLLNIDAHHVPFVLKADFHRYIYDQADSQPDNMDFDLRGCDFASLNAELLSIDWTTFLNGDSVDANVQLFYEKLNEIMLASVPLRRRRSAESSNKMPWWNAELRNMRNRLRKARKRFFSSRTDANRCFLQQLEAAYNQLHTSSYDEYLVRSQSLLKQNPSMFWKYVKAQRTNNRVPNTVSYGSSTSSTSEGAANLFSSFFRSVFNSTSPQIHSGSFENVPSYDLHLPIINFSQMEVQTALQNLEVSKGAGVDGMSPLLLKNCAASLAGPLTLLFNKSMDERTFPSQWKTASMIPIHKSGSLQRVENYRGISILCCPGKILESLVHKVILSASKSIISNYQHGFVPRRSTTTNLMCFTSRLFREIERRNQVDSVYIDFSKAFDAVPHEYTVEKLKHMGFPEWITGWLKSYLTNRKAFVQVNAAKSEEFNIPSGVPQGSVLGPLIFVLFINDLCLQMTSEKLLYADDLKIFRVIKSALECAALQNDINILLKWCNENGMSVNIGKCKVITFSRSGTSINHTYSMGTVALERVQSIRDLGVIIDSKLRFSEHIATVAAKSFSILGFIRRNASQFTDVYALKALFCALVRSILEYASPIWAPYHGTEMIRIERVQKQFVRFALRRLPWNDPVHLPDYAYD